METVVISQIMLVQLLLSLVNIFWISFGSDKENYFSTLTPDREGNIQHFLAQQASAMVNLKPNFLGRIISGHSSGLLDEYL